VWRTAVALLVWLTVLAHGSAAEPELPHILHVAVSHPLALGQSGEVRVTYRAPRANVVAVVQVVEDLDGFRRATRQRELSVVARAFGREAGELLIPLSFATPGRKRVVLWLVTDDRRESERESLELEVLP
jgi:hypothetical protein